MQQNTGNGKPCIYSMLQYYVAVVAYKIVRIRIRNSEYYYSIFAEYIL